MSGSQLPIMVLSTAIALSGTNTEIRDLPEQFLAATQVNERQVHQAAPVASNTAAVGSRSLESPWDATAVDIVQQESRWRDHVTQRLGQLWRGEGDFTGLQIPPKHVVRRARDVAEQLLQPHTPTPSVVPSEDGDVLFIWHKAGWNLEIEIGSEEVSIWARDGSSGTTLYGSLAEYRSEVSGVLTRLAERAS